jgi:hypothetical protein
LRPAAAAVLAAAAAAGLAAGCTPDFDHITTVKDLRVLGITADTPELLFDGGPLSMQETLCLDPATLQALGAELAPRLPETFPPVTLRPLVVDPRGMGRPVRYRAVVCVSPTGTQNQNMGADLAPGGVRNTIGRGQCPEDAPLLAEGEATPLPGGRVPIEVRLDPTRAQVIAAFLADPLGAIYGLPLTVQLTVSAGAEQVIARKRVLIAARLTPDQKPNANPTITRVVHRPDENGVATPFDFADSMREPLAVRLGEELMIEPSRPEADREMYPARIGDRRTGCVTTRPAVEAGRFAFFATAGEFGPASTNTEPPIIREPGTQLHKLASTYRAPRALKPGESDNVRIWIVTRDERAGASFVELAIRLVP